MHDKVKFRAKVLLNYKFIFQFMFRFVLKIQHSIQIKLFLEHKLTFVDGQTEVNQLLNPLFASQG